MRWPWSRRQDKAEDPATAAARELVDAAQAAQPEVSRVVRQLRLIRERNNFAALITAALKEHR